MPYDTGIANRLRAAGIRVVEVAGWQTRGNPSFSPRGSVNHHTAGSANGATPSLNTVIYGRSDLPGPLCHVLQSREPGGNDIAYVVAAGRANHAGTGGFRGLSGNSSVYGLEIEHTGVVPLPEGRQHIAAAIHAAMLGANRADMVCQHFEWTSRKIDAAQNVNPNTFRSWVAAGGGTGPEPEPEPEDEDMMFTVFQDTERQSTPFGIGAPGVWIEGDAEQVQILADTGMAKFPWTQVGARGYDVIKDLCERGAPGEAWRTQLANMVDGQMHTAGDTLVFAHAEAHNAAEYASGERSGYTAPRPPDEPERDAT